ncbi:MAG: hypothetical protein J5669_05640 [Bacteroidales bacterium]|nr:hypothetical protein [Bacteroidales bacterium]
MEEKPTNNVQEPEEEGLDIMALVKGLWAGRKTIIICTSIFIALGLLAALTMKRTYSVNVVMVPQLSSSRTSSLGSLAALAGFDLTTTMSTADLSPLVYPQIVSSVPYRLELLHTPLHYEKLDTAVTMLDYTFNYSKPSVFDVVKKYTIGLPFLLLNALKKEKPDLVMPESDGEGGEKKAVLLTKQEFKMMPYISRCVSLAVDKKEGYVTLNVIGSEPIQTAELAMKAQSLLQEEITRFRTEKAQSELDYIQARYNEIKLEAESLQGQLATVRDRSQSMATTRSTIERERIQSKYNVASSIYSEMAKQLEQAKMKVKKDTPVFTVVQPVTVPSKPSNSRAKTLIVWTFLGGILGCGIVLGKSYLPKVKEMFTESKQ